MTSQQSFSSCMAFALALRRMTFLSSASLSESDPARNLRRAGRGQRPGGLRPGRAIARCRAHLEAPLRGASLSSESESEPEPELEELEPELLLPLLLLLESSSSPVATSLSSSSPSLELPPAQKRDACIGGAANQSTGAAGGRGRGRGDAP
jgi:hypothetical protein